MFDIYLFPSIYEGFGLTVVENEINEKYVFVSDKITIDTKISNRIKYISLDKSSLEWAKKILNNKKIEFKLDNKLNIDDYIKKLKDIYEKS